ncbi:hypothetical protein ES332_A04G120100v1 [Gossypium tomentosum]|uniref:Uncharacterized protein n=1 Tax=Gossypium tomentosum TaxID=34277 RepID=A0A5D2QYR8_GOSTO|nr:hypothetical protein ES332_A04G120100v1 [Gossypium tomentosum]
MMIDVVEVSTQFIYCWCFRQCMKQSILFTIVYASPNAVKCKYLWNHLPSLIPQRNVPWLLVGILMLICPAKKGNEVQGLVWVLVVLSRILCLIMGCFIWVTKG